MKKYTDLPWYLNLKKYRGTIFLPYYSAPLLSPLLHGMKQFNAFLGIIIFLIQGAQAPNSTPDLYI